MYPLVIAIHVLTCITIIALVLVQHGKGADMGAAFGSGASNTVFGSQGSSSFLLKLTGAFATIFFATSLLLGYIASHPVKTGFHIPGVTQISDTAVNLGLEKKQTDASSEEK